MPKQKILAIFGTRPEAIKMAPVINCMRKEPHWDVRICATAQHRHMLDQVLDFFKIKPDFDLNLMKPDQTLAGLTAELVASLSELLEKMKPSLVLVQGDTTSAFAGALAAFYHRIPVGHIEAGLRTGDIYAPFPEEANRRFISVLARLHFAPTRGAAGFLRDEGVCGKWVHVTGNTVIDALKSGISEIDRRAGLRKELQAWFEQTIPMARGILEKRSRLILITGHRRESFGRGFESICRAIKDLSLKFPDDAFVYPVHMNPNVQKPVFRIIGRLPNVFLISPVDYARMLFLLKETYLILTDSGGIQEEAPSLKIPVLVMRDKTERPEAVRQGISMLVGNSREGILGGASDLLGETGLYEAMQSRMKRNPYGDGRASERISGIIKEFLARPDSC